MPPPNSEQSLVSLQHEWRRWLCVRHGPLTQLHEDVLQQATVDLLEWAAQRDGPLESEELRRVGFRILQRRAVDAYRENVRRWATEPLFLEGEDVQSPDLDPEESVEYAQLLKTIVELISYLSASDRDLILRDEFFGGAEKSPALTPAERKRLSRLRQQLQKKLLHKHLIRFEDR